MYVTFKEDIEITMELQDRLLIYYKDITDGKLMRFLFLAAENVTINKEARDNAVTMEDKAMTGASAVVVNSLPYKLIANFYLQFNKPKRPYKVFSNEEDAITWLKTIEL